MGVPMDMTAEISRRVRTANLVLTLVAFGMLATLALGPLYQVRRGVLSVEVIEQMFFPTHPY
jgi:hypothetical protein